MSVVLAEPRAIGAGAGGCRVAPSQPSVSAVNDRCTQVCKSYIIVNATTAPTAMDFTSRRSPVLCTHGCAASSQPLASEIGLRVLRAGGNAADACVAMAAALNVAEPCMTGIGGDAFCLFFDAKSKSVRGLNGSGRCPAALDLAAVRAAMPLDGAAVPGLAEDCSAIADELEAEAEELRQVADAVEESEMEATDEKARVTPDSV